MDDGSGVAGGGGAQPAQPPQDDAMEEEPRDAEAQYQLGIDAGFKKDDKQAVEWWRKAADQGHAEAQASLGELYYNGRGVEKDEKQAVEWWRKAADQGHAEAQYKLRTLAPG